MGGISFVERVCGTDVSSAWNKAYSRAAEDYGTAPYNGSLTTCSLGRVVKQFPMYKKENVKEALNLIESLRGGDKWVANVIDLGVEYVEIPSAKKVTKKPTAKYSTKYSVFVNDERKASFDTKKKADDCALQLAVHNPHDEVVVRKLPVKV